jgi:hypothetical protein
MSIYSKLLNIQQKINGLGKDKQSNNYSYVTGSKVSDSYKYRSMSPVVTFSQGKDQNINFSSDTKWEVYDLFGNIAKQGRGNEIDVSDLKKYCHSCGSKIKKSTYKFCPNCGAKLD